MPPAGVQLRVSILARVPRALFLLAMAAGSALITVGSLAYFDFQELPPFVIEKLPVRFEALWLMSLRVHVAAAAIAFPLCIALMTRALQRRATIHRWLGRIAGGVILLALVPSGTVLAFDAKGGSFVTAGFLLSGALVFGFMAKGIRDARRRDLVRHRHAMRHVFAQMSVAVSSRALLYVFDAAGMSPDLAYVVALWGPVLGSAAAAEWFSSSTSIAQPFTRIGHVFGKVARSLGARSLARPLARLGR